MKKVLLSLVAIAALVGSAVNAEALGVGDSDYIGSIDPATPASAFGEVTLINHLLDAPAGSSQVTGLSSPFHDPVDLFRTGNDCGGTCPDATEAGEDQGNSPSGSVDVTGWTYLLAKYGQVAHVWYVGGTSGFVDVPLDATGGGQSHYSLYNPGTTTVPEGGSTLMLLGAGLAAVGALRRRFNV